MAELKPCPFSGGEAKYENSMEINPVIDDNGAYVDADFVYWETVYCTKCNVQIFSGDNDEEEGYVIELWNNRVNMVTVINPNSSDFWKKFYEIVSPDIDKYLTYYCSYTETCFNICYKGKLMNSLIFNKHRNQFEWVDDEIPITFWGCDKEIKKSISNAFKQLLGSKASDLCKSLELKVINEW